MGLFYLYYFSIEVRKCRKEMKAAGPVTGFLQHFRHPSNWMMLTNNVLYFIQLMFRIQANSILPAAMAVESADFHSEIRSSLRTQVIGRKLNAANTFLNWFKMISYLSYAPSFAVLTDTLVSAAPEVFGFSFIFFVIFFGSSDCPVPGIDDAKRAARGVRDHHLLECARLHTAIAPNVSAGPVAVREPPVQAN